MDKAIVSLHDHTLETMHISLFRFCGDLAMFDDLDITESTLQILDTYLGKPHFDHVYMNNRTENPALVMLVKWVSGVSK
jgi:hypothetical protein